MSVPIGNIVNKINVAKSILLTTHRQCDGDGFGCCVAMYHALKKMGKDVRIITVDEILDKYNFLEHKADVFLQPHKLLGSIDLTLIFDTNDRKLVEPLFSELETKSKEIMFIDHHPPLSYGVVYPNTFIETQASATGEIAFRIIEALKVRMDRDIARALYTSLIFDTNMFKYVKNPEKLHSICSELLKYETDPEEIYREVFGTPSFEKISFISSILSRIELHFDRKFALFYVSQDDLNNYNLDYCEAYSILEILLDVHEIECIAMIRQEKDNQFKLSLRSKNDLEILSIAEHFKGGGHLFAAGATVGGNLESLKSKLIALFQPRLNGSKQKHKTSPA